MKRIFLLYVLASLLAIQGFSQSNEWTKEDRNNIYNDFLSYVGKYYNLSIQQKESVSLCYLDEVTKKYTKKDYYNKIDIEINKIKETTLPLCSKKVGIEFFETRKEEIKIEEPKKEEPKKEEPKKEPTTLNPTKEVLAGHWKDDNSEFWLFETGDFKMQYKDGEIAKGTWKIDGDQLNLYKDMFFGISEKIFKILVFTNDKFVYQSIKSKKQTFTASRMK